MNITPEQEDTDGRRPLKVREVGIAQRCAVWLSSKDITPNQISIASIGFAALAALCFILLPSSIDLRSGTSNLMSLILPILAAVLIQCRLLCNLFDGMVAVEGGKSTPAGELFNDIPDRIADPLILICAGYAVTSLAFGPALGWCAGLLAVMTAYVRTLSASIGAPVNFQGPMAKQHRMATMTIASLLVAFEAYFWSSTYALVAGLVIVNLGCFLTLANRSRKAYLFLENAQSQTES